MTSKAVCLCLVGALVGAVASSAWAANPGDVIITEIMYNPASDENSPAITEWIEIYNTTANPIDITGWYIADEDGRSGAFEPYTLPAHGIAVVIPKGTSSKPLTKADFTAAWGTPAEKLVQVTDEGDQSGPRPGNAPQGVISGSGLSNSPANNGVDSDDLENTPWGTPPCNYGQNLCVTTPTSPPRDSEVELLVDNNNQIIDKVGYDDSSPWPSAANGPSIIIKDVAYLDATSNDSGANWEKSVKNQKRAWTNTQTPIFTSAGGDIGSPGEIEGITTGNQPPSASGSTIWTTKGGSWTTTLQGSDDGLPEPATLSFIVDSLPANGALYDVDNGDVQITTVPYTIPNQKKRVRYANNGTCGNTSVAFHTFDGALNSTSATVTILVQCGDLIITEIMYNPASNETLQPKVTEWIEVYNTTDSAIDVSGWYLTDKDGRSGDWPEGTSIPAHGVAVVIPRGVTGDRFMTPELFTASWDGYTIPQFITPTATNDTASGELVRGGLANSPGGVGELLRIVDATGKVQDIASYTNTSSWPVSNGESSIYLQEGKYDVASNDVGANWANSRDCAGGAYGCLIGGFFDATDFGSPGFLSGVTAPTGNIPPTPLWQRKGVLMDSVDNVITLTNCDDGNPSGGPVTYRITSLPSHGSLKDGSTSITTTPYTLAGNTVLYTPEPGYTCSVGTPDDSFTFGVNDGAKSSRGDGTVRLVVQRGGLVITEIMYDPSNQADNDWEWIEIKNTSNEAITLYSITNDVGEPDSNGYINQVIPAGAIRIIASGDNASRTTTEFLAEWGPLDPSIVIFIDPLVSGWEYFGNSGGRLQLIDSDAKVRDDVIYNTSAPWPVPDGKGSIYVKDGKLNVLDNDLGENWLLSTAGVDNAYATPETPGTPTDSDVGSPGLLPVACSPPSVSAIDTAYRQFDGTYAKWGFSGETLVGVKVTGAGFTAGATVKLKKAGQADITASNVTVDGATQITCDLNLAGAAVGLWDVVVRTCADGTLAASFEVSPACAAVPQNVHKDYPTDADVDINDFTVFTSCFNGPNRAPGGSADITKCRCLDQSRNGDIDLVDFSAFSSCFNGPNNPAACGS